MTDPTFTTRAALKEWAKRRAFDKTGREIMVGDVLKVYHFRGARWRKHYYMFKQIVGTKVIGKGRHVYLVVSHLNMKSADEKDGGYLMPQDGTLNRDTEIVQGIDWHHDRPRLVHLHTHLGDE